MASFSTHASGSLPSFASSPITNRRPPSHGSTSSGALDAQQNDLLRAAFVFELLDLVERAVQRASELRSVSSPRPAPKKLIATSTKPKPPAATSTASSPPAPSCAAPSSKKPSSRSCRHNSLASSAPALATPPPSETCYMRSTTISSSPASRCPQRPRLRRRSPSLPRKRAPRPPAPAPTLIPGSMSTLYSRHLYPNY